MLLSENRGFMRWGQDVQLTEFKKLFTSVIIIGSSHLWTSSTYYFFFKYWNDRPPMLNSSRKGERMGVEFVTNLPRWQVC